MTIKEAKREIESALRRTLLARVWRGYCRQDKEDYAGELASGRMTLGEICKRIRREAQDTIYINSWFES